MKKLGVIIFVLIVLIVGIKLLLPKTIVVLGYHDFTNSNSNDEFIMNSEDFERQINQILSVIPKERITFLFSATMTSKVQKLQKASLKNPVKILRECIYNSSQNCNLTNS